MQCTILYNKDSTISRRNITISTSDQVDWIKENIQIIDDKGRIFLINPNAVETIILTPEEK